MTPYIKVMRDLSDMHLDHSLTRTYDQHRPQSMREKIDNLESDFCFTGSYRFWSVRQLCGKPKPDLRDPAC